MKSCEDCRLLERDEVQFGVFNIDFSEFVTERTRTLPFNLRLFGLVLCGLVLSACSQEPEVFTGPFIVRDGITYDQNTNEPLAGIVEEFYDDGQLESRGTFRDGELNGLYEEFYENGQLSFRGNYKDGKQDGLLEYFDKDGNPTSTETYRDGELVEVN